jgi:ribosomal protein L11 methyltransferase
METKLEIIGKNRCWTEISCEVPEEAVDVVADFLAVLTGGGITVENRFVDAFSQAEIEDLPRKTVKGYLPPEAGVEGVREELETFLRSSQGLFPEERFGPVSVSTVSEEDWAGTWKLNFTATRIGERIIVKPTWEEYSPLAGETVIDIDPGMAFGTGTHPTTRLCLRAVEEFFSNHPGLPQPKVLDVGTGSGILAIAAAKMGGEVTGIDIDPEALETAAQNADLNGVATGISFSPAPLEELCGGYDLILANILAEELVRLATSLVERLRPSGVLVLSGILSEKDPLVLSGFEKFPLTHVRTDHEEEWSGIVYRRNE